MPSSRRKKANARRRRKNERTKKSSVPEKKEEDNWCMVIIGDRENVPEDCNEKEQKAEEGPLDAPSCSHQDQEFCVVDDDADIELAERSQVVNLGALTDAVCEQSSDKENGYVYVQAIEYSEAVQEDIIHTNMYRNATGEDLHSQQAQLVFPAAEKSGGVALVSNRNQLVSEHESSEADEKISRTNQVQDDGSQNFAEDIFYCGNNNMADRYMIPQNKCDT